MVIIAVAIVSGFVLLALVMHVHASADRKVKIEIYREVRNVHDEFATLKITAQRLMDMTSKELDARTEAIQAAEHDRRKLAAAELEQAVAEGRARRIVD